MKLDTVFIMPFVEGAIKTLKIQCNVETKALKPFFKGQGSEIIPDIAAVIGLTNESFTGSIAIKFPGVVFLKIMSNMLGEDFKEINKDLEDGASELLNIIFGQAKAVLNDKGYKIEKAIPTIVRGSGLHVRHLTKQAALILPFETSLGGVFEIEIATSESK